MIPSDAQHAVPAGPRDCGQGPASTGSGSFAPELIAVVLLILVLVGSGVVGHFRAQARRGARLQAATAALCAEACAQRDLLVSAIVSYKRSLGFYPPDHLVCREPLAVAVDAVTNALLYELMGSYQDRASDSFISGSLPGVRRSLLKQLFGIESLRNSAEKPEAVRSFLDATNLITVYAVVRAPDPVGLLSIWPRSEAMGSDLYQCFDITSWRYNCSAPAHNPGGFDLWLEINTPQTNVLVKNW